MYRTVATFSLCASLFVCFGTHANNHHSGCCAAAGASRHVAPTEIGATPSEGVLAAVVLMSLLQAHAMAEEGRNHDAEAGTVQNVCAAGFGATASSRSGCAQPISIARPDR